MHQKLIVGRLACACPIACSAHYFHLREKKQRWKIQVLLGDSLFPVWLLAALLDAPTDLVPEAFHMQMSQSFTFLVFFFLFDDFYFSLEEKKGPTHFRVNNRLYACARYSGPQADENRCGGDVSPTGPLVNEFV